MASEIVGFAGIGPSRDPIDPELGELDTIAIDPAHWRRGVGRALMAVVVGHLETDGYRAAIVWALENYPQGQRVTVHTFQRCLSIVRTLFEKNGQFELSGIHK